MSEIDAAALQRRWVKLLRCSCCGDELYDNEITAGVCAFCAAAIAIKDSEDLKDGGWVVDDET